MQPSAEEDIGKKGQDGIIGSRPRYTFKALPRTSTPSTSMSLKDAALLSHGSSPALTPTPPPPPTPTPTLGEASSPSSPAVPTRSTSMLAVIRRGSADSGDRSDIDKSSVDTVTTVSNKQLLEELLQGDDSDRETVGGRGDEHKEGDTNGLADIDKAVSHWKGGEERDNTTGRERNTTLNITPSVHVPVPVPTTAPVPVPVSLSGPESVPLLISDSLPSLAPVPAPASLYGPCTYREYFGSEEDHMSDRLDLLGEGKGREERTLPSALLCSTLSPRI